MNTVQLVRNLTRRIITRVYIILYNFSRKLPPAVTYILFAYAVLLPLTSTELPGKPEVSTGPSENLHPVTTEGMTTSMSAEDQIYSLPVC